MNFEMSMTAPNLSDINSSFMTQNDDLMSLRSFNGGN
jgi:hypothetical protein